MCAYRQPSNLMRMLVNCCLSMIPTLVGNSKCMKPRCMVCDMLDTRNKFKVKALPFNLETTIVILIAMSIYSCLANVTLEIKSVRHQSNYDLDLIIIYGASETTAGISRWLFISTNPTIRLEIRDVILRGDFKSTADRLICEQTLIHKFNRHIKVVSQDLSQNSNCHMCWQHLTFMSDNNTEVWRQKLSDVFLIFAITVSTPSRNDTGVFEGFDRLFFRYLLE